MADVQIETKNGEAPKPSAAALRARLDRTTEDIQLRLDAIKQEVRTIPRDATRAVLDHPAIGLGAALAGGLVVGLLVGKPKRKASPLDQALAYLPKAQRRHAERYAEAVEDEVRKALRKGHDAGEAVRGFLGRHAPPIVVAEPEEKKERGLIAGALAGALTTALSFAFKTAVQAAIAGFAAKAGADEAAGEAKKAAGHAAAASGQATRAADHAEAA